MSLITTLFESYCTIQRAAISRDASQGVVQTYSIIIAANVACSCQQAGASVRDLYAQRNTFVTTTIYFAQDPTTNVNDRIIVTEPRTGKTFTYLVKGEAESGTSRGRLWSVDCELIRAPGVQ